MSASAPHFCKVRAIGVSNFQSGRFFDFAHYVELKPMVESSPASVQASINLDKQARINPSFIISLKTRWE